MILLKITSIQTSHQDREKDLKIAKLALNGLEKAKVTYRQSTYYKCITPGSIISKTKLWKEPQLSWQEAPNTNKFEADLKLTPML